MPLSFGFDTQEMLIEKPKPKATSPTSAIDLAIEKVYKYPMELNRDKIYSLVAKTTLLPSGMPTFPGGGKFIEKCHSFLVKYFCFSHWYYEPADVILILRELRRLAALYEVKSKPGVTF